MKEIITGIIAGVVLAAGGLALLAFMIVLIS